MHPGATTATGFLQGWKIQLPTVLPVPVTIEKLSLEAKNTVLLIKSATVSSGESRVDASGSVTYLKDKYAVDVDVKGDQIIVPKSPAKSEPEASMKSAAESHPQRVKSNANCSSHCGTSRYREPSASISAGSRPKLQIAIGSATLEAEALDLGSRRGSMRDNAIRGRAGPETDDAEVKLTARGAQLHKSIPCLTKQRVQVTGKLDMDGAFSAQGKLGTLPGH